MAKPLKVMHAQLTYYYTLLVDVIYLRQKHQIQCAVIINERANVFIFGMI